MDDDERILILGALLHDVGKFLERAEFTEKVEDNNIRYSHPKIGAYFLKEYLKFDGDIVDLVLYHHNPEYAPKNIRDLCYILQLADWLSSGEREETSEEIDAGRKHQCMISVFNRIKIKLFSWDEIPGNDNRLLIDFLKQRLDIGWVETAKIEKIDDGKSIRVSTEKNYLSLGLNNEKTKLNLKIDDARTLELMAKTEKDKLNIYEIKKNTRDINYEECDKYEIRPLKLDDSIFPKKNPKIINYGHILEGIKNPINPNEEYFRLNNFKTEIKEKNIKDPSILLSILQKYWWCVPAQTYWHEKAEYLPDISLFDHSKTTCAIALCLYKLSKAGVINGGIIEGLLKNPPWKEKRNPEVWKKNQLFKLIHGDISGIQDFIYTIKTKGAAKSLKGRSLALVLLQRFIAEHVLKKMDLQLTNLIFSGGGHFYILAPYDLSGRKLGDIKKEINEKLFDKFGTKLYLTLGCVDLCPEDFTDSNFSGKWCDVAEENSKQKLRKYNEFEYEKIFKKEFDVGGTTNLCSICNSNKNVRTYNDGDTQMDMCSDCISFKDIGSYLKNIQSTGGFNISEIKRKLSILSGLDTLLDGEVYLTPDNLPFLSLPMGIPIKEGNKIKEFDELAEDAEENTGTKKIAILKMDVDNLGKIFTQGLGEHATISRMSTLSNMLSLFFEGYLNEFIKQKYSNDIYLIYAGGDDTLVVGRWDKLIDFAGDVYNEFRKYTCNNPDITISAGIVVVGPKYPLRKSVDHANNLIDDVAKKGDKNAIGIFWHKLKWCVEEDKGLNEFEKVRELGEILVKSVREDKAPKQLIQRVKFSMEELKKGMDEDGKGVNLKYYWRLKYYFHKNYYDEKEKCWKYPEVGNLEGKIYSILDENLFNRGEKYAIHLIPIAARIAELKTRKEE